MTFLDIIDIIYRTGETPENLWMLGRWFEQFGEVFWNGECYNTEVEFNGRNLYPVWDSDPVLGDFISGYELR